MQPNLCDGLAKTAGSLPVFYFILAPVFVVVVVVAGSYDAHCRRDVPHLFHVAGSG